MNPLIIFGLIQGVVTIIGKVMDGYKTKTGLSIVATGAALPALSMFGVDVTPDAVVQTIQQIIGLFGYHFVGDAQQNAQVLVGSLLGFIGAAVSLYGYHRKGALITK